MAVFPAQVSYQEITLTSNIVVTWPFTFSSNTIIANINDVNAANGPFSITLPNATLAAVGQTILFNNVGAHTFEVLDNNGGLLQVIDSGEVKYFYLTGTVTSAGTWEDIPFGGGVTAITTFTAQSSDSTINITNGTVPAQGTTINFKLPTSIANLNSVNAVGFPVITSKAPLTWLTRDIVAGNNITITNGDGIAANPIINLTDTLLDLTAITVGNLDINGSEISSIATNTGVTLSSNGTGSIDLNGVIIDTIGNVSDINNLTVTGTFKNALTPKAWCTFTDTLIGTSTNVIVVRDQSNIASIAPVTGQSGTYTLTFSSALSNNYYGVLVSTGTIISDGIPLVTHGFSIYSSQLTTSCRIVIVDASGQPVLQAPNGVTVQILSST